MSHIRKKAIAGLAKGDTFSVSRTFRKQDVLQFAEISRDYNPIHFDPRFSNVKKIDGLICHGLLVASLITEIDDRGRAKAEAVFTNENNMTVLEAVLVGIVPGIQEKQVMQDMLAEGDLTNKISY